MCIRDRCNDILDAIAEKETAGQTEAEDIINKGEASFFRAYCYFNLVRAFYLDVFNRGFQYAFMAAIGAMLVSLIIYMANKKRFPDCILYTSRCV